MGNEARLRAGSSRNKRAGPLPFNLDRAAVGRSGVCNQGPGHEPALLMPRQVLFRVLFLFFSRRFRRGNHLILRQESIFFYCTRMLETLSYICAVIGATVCDFLGVIGLASRFRLLNTAVHVSWSLAPKPPFFFFCARERQHSRHSIKIPLLLRTAIHRTRIQREPVPVLENSRAVLYLMSACSSVRCDVFKRNRIAVSQYRQTKSLSFGICREQNAGNRNRYRVW